MAQYGFNQFGGGQNNGNGSIDPNDLSMSGTNVNFGGSNGGYSSGSALFGEEELLDSLNSPTEPPQGMHNQGQDYGGMNDINMGFQQGMYTSQMNGYSNTPEGDPIQSPFVHSFGAQPQFRQMQQQPFNSLQSPVSFSGSPITGGDVKREPDYLNAKSPHARLTQSQAQAMQRKASNNRSPLTTSAAAAMASLTVGSHESPGFGAAQPIRTPGGHHEKSPPGQWLHTPNSLSSFPGSGVSSPLQHGYANPQLAEVMRPGTSMPARLGGPNISTQEAKRKRRRESHNAVERRRRDNINERIQDLSKLVPSHRLEDEKIRKLIQNGTPLSPSLTGISQPGQATSGLAGPGAKRATGAGNITTGLPLEDKDKGPNKGDILNGAVSWTRDLMWMLQIKIQQQEELLNTINELGGHFPLEITDDEKRMQTELMEAMSKNDPHSFSYTRFNGSGLRVPRHTDYKGDPLNGAIALDDSSTSPGDDNEVADLGDLDTADHFFHDADDLKEEDEYMDFNP